MMATWGSVIFLASLFTLKKLGVVFVHVHEHVFGFTHVVAGSAEALFGVLTGEFSLAHAVGHFFLPTLAGNVFGGTVLFAVLSYAQVRTEMPE